ncbi:protein phosphatase 2C 29-like [Olea europaea var. sylvestris]|uniref:protein phosphatase 2C 29-like n=1 Tax=Olea europaea var. sylvestris TaxID=158386 RepID=UPI000C1D3676|nr:protein phosphatase 2C 29-like [Olea europaea var. sylvestris]
MGAGFSQVFPCFNPSAGANRDEEGVIFSATEPLDETLGHSFCYVRSSARFVSPTHSDRFVSPSQSLRFDDPQRPKPPGIPETGFRAISGASVSANTWTPRTVLDDIYDGAIESNNNSNAPGYLAGTRGSVVNGFESTSSFSALPLQPLPRDGKGEPPSGPLERAFFMSGPIERGAMSGPLDSAAGGIGPDSSRVPFSAPLGNVCVKKRKKGISGFRKALYKNFSERKRPWVVPVRYLVGGGRKDIPLSGESSRRTEMGSDSNVHWALGKAGEDRVNVVVSEEHGWLFVGIYDGFNGPDAPEFLMSKLYRAMYNELEGLFWESEEAVVASENAVIADNSNLSQENQENEEAKEGEVAENETKSERKVTFQEEQIGVRRRRLWEFLAEDDPGEGLDLSGSDRFAFSVDDALNLNDAGSAVNGRSLLLSKLKHGLLSKHKDKDGRRLFPWRFWFEGKEKVVGEMEESNRVAEEEGEGISRNGRKPKVGPVDHELVLRAMSRALEVTERAYLDMTDKVLDQYPELALMGSCLLVVLMRDEDVYVMNVGDSRAIVAQHQPEEVSSSAESKVAGDDGLNAQYIVEELSDVSEKENKKRNEDHVHQAMRLSALQLSTDHSTSIEEVCPCNFFLLSVLYSPLFIAASIYKLYVHLWLRCGIL